MYATCLWQRTNRIFLIFLLSPDFFLSYPLPFSLSLSFLHAFFFLSLIFAFFLAIIYHQRDKTKKRNIINKIIYLFIYFLFIYLFILLPFTVTLLYVSGIKMIMLAN